jgi:hypothetical protein
MSTPSTNGTTHTPVNRIRERTAARRRATAPPNDDAAGVPAPPSPSGDTGRNAQGRFTKGNPGGPGNPFARRTAQLRSVLCQTVTEEDIAEIARKLIAQAKAGDVAAARLVLAYSIGQPTPAVNPDTLDTEEWRTYRQQTIAVDDLKRVTFGMPAWMACELAGSIMPYMAVHIAAILKAGFDGDTAALEALRPAPPRAEDDSDAMAHLDHVAMPPSAARKRRATGARGRTSPNRPDGGGARSATASPPSPNGDNGTYEPVAKTVRKK